MFKSIRKVLGRGRRTIKNSKGIKSFEQRWRFLENFKKSV
ncbi:MAG: hypothetical protein CM15mV25_1660 [uncultured marine virus]|nr:MAG: hypothetical protein CM15mV25_1660 [uncultured marine virus]